MGTRRSGPYLIYSARPASIILFIAGRAHACLKGLGSYCTESSQALVYIYLFPVALIAALYNGRLALLSAALALVCADYFLQEPLYSLANDDPREYGDLFVFALLAVTAIKFVRVSVRPPRIAATKSRSA